MRSARSWNAPNTDRDRKSTRLNSSHTEIYTLSLHDALPISSLKGAIPRWAGGRMPLTTELAHAIRQELECAKYGSRSEEHTSELQSHRDLHSFPTRRSSDLEPKGRDSALGGRQDAANH